MTRQRFLIAAAALAISAAAGGCSSSGTSLSGASGTKITIQNFAFKPSPLKAKVGDTITVTNKDNTDHSLTADDNSVDTGRFSTGTKTITVTKAGELKYHCAVHSTMTGVIQVGA